MWNFLLINAIHSYHGYTFLSCMNLILDLVGTAILPVGLLLTYYLIFKSIITKYDDWFSFVPTVLLAFVIFMPALLMMLTKLKASRLGWMMIYLLALPIWNFVLPVYAFWRFDDFSWGATRYFYHYFK